MPSLLSGEEMTAREPFVRASRERLGGRSFHSSASIICQHGSMLLTLHAHMPQRSVHGPTPSARAELVRSVVARWSQAVARLVAAHRYAARGRGLDLGRRPGDGSAVASESASWS